MDIFVFSYGYYDSFECVQQKDHLYCISYYLPCEWEQNLSFPIMSLWHKDYPELVIFKETKDTGKGLKAA